MFDSLADRIREDAHNEVNPTQRLVRGVTVLVLSFLLFGGLYMAVRMLE